MKTSPNLHQLSNKFNSWLKLAAISALLLTSLILGNAVEASTGCAPNDPDIHGWPKNSTVYYSIGGFPPAVQAQIEQAFALWNAANGQNGSNVTFQAEDENHPATFTVSPGPAVASTGPAAALTNVISPFGTTTGAQTLIDIDNTEDTWYAEGQTGYDNVFLKVMLHEIGHTMGLNDVPVPDIHKTCGDQTAGNSVMNGKCDVNDQGNNLPTNVQPCDNLDVNSNFQYNNALCNPAMNECQYQGGVFDTTTCSCNYYSYQPNYNYGGNYGWEMGDCYDSYEVTDTYYDPGDGEDLQLINESWEYLGTSCY